MSKYRKKPVVIEAVEWTGNNPIQIACFCGKYAEFDDRKELLLTTLENTKENKFEASKGDFIIKGVKGEFYACKPDIFRMTYESADAKTKDDIFIQHIKGHLKPEEKVICKICGKTAEEIIKQL